MPPHYFSTGPTMGKDTWMEEYKALERSGDAIMENITQRNRTNKNGGDALKVVYKLCYWGRGVAEFVRFAASGGEV